MKLENIWKFTDKSDLSGYTLIIPSVAVGNVGQLACDLLISSFRMNKVASVYSSALIPILGYDPYDTTSNKLSGSCEVYKSEEKHIVVLQVRAPLVYKLAQEFLENVIRTFKEKQVKDIIILSSSYAHEKKHILTSPFRYLANELCPHRNKLNEFNWLEHEVVNPGSVKIFGGGFAAMLYDLVTANNLPCLLLYKYCSEGDNIPDAYEVINQLADILPLFIDKTNLFSELLQPISWKLLFGRPPPQDIY